MSDADESQVSPQAPKNAPAADNADKPLLGGRYRLIRRLGKGGMGEVFLAQHATIEKHVAIKILLPDRAKDETQKARFLNEAKATARIRHPNVIDISDFGETDDGRTFFVMEYLAGEDLKKHCRRNHISTWKNIELILLQVCSGLGAAHKQGIIHRDLKPDNIFLIEHQGIENFVKILDFGLAKMIDDDRSKKLTKTGIIVGTPAFLSPEQIKGDAIDHRADIYAMGLILYRMLCGQLPFKAKTVVDMLRKQLMEAPLAPSVMAPDALITPAADQIALKALAKNADDRFQNTQELGEAIADVKNHPGGVQIAVPQGPGHAPESAQGGGKNKPQLEIVIGGPPTDDEIVVPLGSARAKGGGPSADRQDLTGPTNPMLKGGEAAAEPASSPAFQVAEPKENGDGVITPEGAAKSFRSQLLSRPDEVDATQRQEQQGPRGVPLGVVLLIVAVLGGLIIALILTR
ncbi:MAG: serine/threonine protein kinase [Deltaproteobacteria bacterium]|nr:serine/threonine protein kinase [Deltaproteobacteria bacterium]